MGAYKLELRPPRQMPPQPDGGEGVRQMSGFCPYQFKCLDTMFLRFPPSDPLSQAELGMTHASSNASFWGFRFGRRFSLPHGAATEPHGNSGFVGRARQGWRKSKTAVGNRCQFSKSGFAPMSPGPPREAVCGSEVQPSGTERGGLTARTLGLSPFFDEWGGSSDPRGARAPFARFRACVASLAYRRIGGSPNLGSEGRDVAWLPTENYLIL